MTPIEGQPTNEYVKNLILEKVGDENRRYLEDSLEGNEGGFLNNSMSQERVDSLFKDTQSPAESIDSLDDFTAYIHSICLVIAHRMTPIERLKEVVVSLFDTMEREQVLRYAEIDYLSLNPDEQIEIEEILLEAVSKQEDGLISNIPNRRTYIGSYIISSAVERDLKNFFDIDVSDPDDFSDF